MSNIRIKAIQYNTEDLYPALDALGNGFNIVYSNLKSSINLNGIKFKNRKFDTMLYNEEDNVMILLMRNGIVKKDDIIHYLEMYNKSYVEVTFENCLYDYEDRRDIPELVFVNNKKDLNEEIINCLNEELDNCKYYSLLNGTFDLGYMSKYSYRCSIDKSSYRGVLNFYKKLILLSDEFNLNQESVINILKSFRIKYILDEDKHPNLFVYGDKDKVKNLKLERFEYFK